METDADMEQVYEECKTHGLRAVARQLGLDCQQLLVRLHEAGVMRSRTAWVRMGCRTRPCRGLNREED